METRNSCQRFWCVNIEHWNSVESVIPFLGWKAEHTIWAENRLLLEHYWLFSIAFVSPEAQQLYISERNRQRYSH